MKGKKEKNPLVSVIITTKEEGKYIGKTLHAVRRQTYRPIEIVVCDAESRDDTVAIAREYSAKIIVRKSNIPQGRNIAARNSHGDILVSLDADTILPADYVEKAVRELKAKRADMVIGSFRPIEKTMKGSIICIIWSEIIPSILRIFGMEAHGGPSTLVIKREFFFRMHGYNERLTLAEDADLTNRVSKIGKVFWDRRLVARTSMRRLEKGGYLKWLFIWVFGSPLVLFFGKSMLRRYKVIR